MNATTQNKWQPYPAYKDSGVEWLGEIPEHWEMKRLKWVLSSLEVGYREAGGGSQLDKGIFSLGGEHIGWRGELLLSEPKFISEEFYNNLSTGKIQEDDVLLVRDGATIGKTAIIRSLPFEGRSSLYRET